MQSLRRFGALMLAIYLTSFCCGCGKQPAQAQTRRATCTSFRLPQAPGEVVYGNDLAAVDASNARQGYVQLTYLGTAQKAKVQITGPDGGVYTYTLAPGEGAFLPLTAGPGRYSVQVLENAYDNMYALVLSQELEVDSVDPFLPYLYPNQLSWFTPDSQVVRLGVELSDQSGSDMDYVTRVYRYVTERIDYDLALAQDPPVDYVPSPDETLTRQTGICFDYASLMTALLRSQGIPTKLVVGYSGQQYHAWISVYLEETGWMDKTIYFDGTSWVLVDPTLGATNRASEVKRYVGDGSNYLPKYQY